MSMLTLHDSEGNGNVNRGETSALRPTSSLITHN